MTFRVQTCRMFNFAQHRWAVEGKQWNINISTWNIHDIIVMAVDRVCHEAWHLVYNIQPYKVNRTEPNRKTGLCQNHAFSSMWGWRWRAIALRKVVICIEKIGDFVKCLWTAFWTLRTNSRSCSAMAERPHDAWFTSICKMVKSRF